MCVWGGGGGVTQAEGGGTQAEAGAADKSTEDGLAIPFVVPYLYR